MTTARRSRQNLGQTHAEPDLAKRAERTAGIQRDIAQGSEEAAAVYRRTIEKLRESAMSYGQISAALGIARGTVQGHAEHSRRAGLVPGLIFAFRDKDGNWYPDRPEAILPGGPYATGDSIKIRGDRPNRFAGQELVCSYEDTPSGRIPDDSPVMHITSPNTVGRGALPGQSTMQSGKLLRTRQGARTFFRDIPTLAATRPSSASTQRTCGTGRRSARHCPP